MRVDGSLLPPLDLPRGVTAEPFERLAPIRLGRETCGDLAAAERREWWVGNGLGGYAAGTVASTLTRRYHGLLIAPVDPPLGRALVFAKADAELVIGEERYPLFTNRWASGAVSPKATSRSRAFISTARHRFGVSDRRLPDRAAHLAGTQRQHHLHRLAPAGDASRRCAAPYGRAPRQRS